MANGEANMLEVEVGGDMLDVGTELSRHGVGLFRAFHFVEYGSDRKGPP